MSPLHEDHHPNPPPNRTLSHFYTSQTSLKHFLPSLFPPVLNLQLLRPEDPSALKDLLDGTLVCLEPSYEGRTWNEVEPSQGSTVSEVSSSPLPPSPPSSFGPCFDLRPFDSDPQPSHRPDLRIRQGRQTFQSTHQRVHVFSLWVFRELNSPFLLSSPRSSPLSFFVVFASSPATPIQPTTFNVPESTASISTPTTAPSSLNELGRCFSRGELDQLLDSSRLPFELTSSSFFIVELVPDLSTTSSLPLPSSCPYRTNASLRSLERR